MLSENLSKLKNTLSFRLTIWYTVIFTISSLAAFFIIYLVIEHNLIKQIDKDLIEDIGKYSSLYSDRGIEGIMQELKDEELVEEPNEESMQILNLDGKVIVSTSMHHWKNMKPNTKALKKIAKGAEYVIGTYHTPEMEYGVRYTYGAIGPDLVLCKAESLESVMQFLGIFRDAFLSAVIFILIFSSLVGWFMAKRAMAGVKEVTATALDISSGGALDRRVPVKSRGDEIELLAITFNRMLDHINALVAGIRDMTSDIAHDLKSPITGIRGMAEIALIGDVSVEEYKNTTADIIGECDRLLTMINSTLDIAEADAGAGKLDFKEVDITQILKDACELFDPLAEKKNISLQCDTPDKLIAEIDIRSFQRMAANLIDNAIKYTPDNGEVKISASKRNGKITISVSDTGIGIAENDIPNVFKRFFRCDKSRSQAGTGLGLSLVSAIARSHNGEVSVTSKIGLGSTFIVTLPDTHNS